MKAFTLNICVVGTLVFTSCSKSPPSAIIAPPCIIAQSAIIGRWHQVGTPGSAVFHEDSTVEVYDGRAQMSGKFSFFTDHKLPFTCFLELDLVSSKGVALGRNVYCLEFADANTKMTWFDIVYGEKTEFLKDK
jgi:hypothetical protein